jgi:ParB family chromosome partitioning protein
MKKKFEGVDWAAPATAFESPRANSKSLAATAPGAEFQRVADTRSQMLKENETLKAQVQAWDGAVPTRKIPTNLIVRSKFANRHETNFDSEEFASLRDEIKNAGGNVQPIKVRPVEGGKFEVVFGHRRLEACRLNRLDVLAIVEELDDQALFVEMDRENRSRKDLSPWEQGVMYQRAIQEGLFPSNKKLAEALGVDVTNLGKAISLAELPVEIVDAFASPLDLQYRWAKPLREAFAANPNACIAHAKKLAAMNSKPKASDVFVSLTTGATTAEYPSQSNPTFLQVTVGNKSVARILQSKKGATDVHFSSPLNREMTQALFEFIENLMKS